MKYSSKSELILKGPMYLVLAILATPIMIANLIQTLYNVVDGLFVKELGNMEFSATALVWPVIFLFISIGTGLSVGGTSIISQLLGSGEDERANKYAKQHFMLCIFAGFLAAISAYFVAPGLVYLMGAEGDMYRLSTSYLRIMMFGLPAQFAYYGFHAIMQAQGKPVVTTVIGAVGAVMNTVLDPIFIFKKVPFLGIKGFGLGVKGAAIASVISTFIVMIIGILSLNRLSERIKLSVKDYRYDAQLSRHIISVTGPSSLGMAGSAMGFVILNRFILSYGNNTIFAFTMVNRLTSILMQPMMGLGSSLTAIVGQCIGAGKLKRAKEAFFKAVKVNLIIAVSGGVFIFLCDKWIVAISTAFPSKDLVEQSIEYLHYTALTIFFMGLFSVLQGFFQGTGHTKYSMHMAIGRLWIIRIPCILIFKNFTNLGATGVWWAMCFSNVLIVLYGFAVYFRGKWSRRII